MQAAERAQLQAELRYHERQIREEVHAMRDSLRALTAPTSGTRTVAAMLPYVAFVGLGLVLLRGVRWRRPLARVLLPAAIEIWRAWSSAPRAQPALPSPRHPEHE